MTFEDLQCRKNDDFVIYVSPTLIVLIVVTMVTMVTNGRMIQSAAFWKDGSLTPGIMEFLILSLAN